MADYSAYNPAVTRPAFHRLYYESESSSAAREPNPHDGVTKASSPSSDETTAKQKERSQQAAPTKYDRGWRRVVRNFSPSWFSVTMGTGIVAVLLDSIPFRASWLYYLSIVFFVLNTILFAAALLISILRYTLYPEIWVVMIRDSTNSLFLATIPMGFATLIRMWVNVCVPAWGGGWTITFAWVLWMIDAIVAAGLTVFLSFTLMSEEDQSSLSRITAAQLLPIAGTIVAAATGSAVADVLPNPDHALGTVITCYVLWGMSVPLALVLLVIYYQRLAVHKLPSREVIVSCFLPLGPLGYGGFAILYLGRICLKLFPQTHSLSAAGDVAAPILYVVGFLFAIIMWGFGIMWLIFALATIWKSRPFPFNMGWWGFTFPLGVFAASTILIGEELASLAFRVFGTIFSVAVILLWIVVAAGTIRGGWSGKLFHAPCLQNLKKREEAAEKYERQGDEKDAEAALAGANGDKPQE